MMDMFDGCSTREELISRRNLLAKEFHPDNLTRIMQEINDAYETARRKLADTKAAEQVKDTRRQAYLYLISLGMSENVAKSRTGYESKRLLTA